jgi:hypothetical protein
MDHSTRALKTPGKISQMGSGNYAPTVKRYPSVHMLSLAKTPSGAILLDWIEVRGCRILGGLGKQETLVCSLVKNHDERKVTSETRTSHIFPAAFPQIDHQGGSPRVRLQDRSDDASLRPGTWRSPSLKGESFCQ